MSVIVNSGKHLLALSFSGFDPGCVKTCTSQECAELFSLSSSLSGGRKHFWFSNLRNRDGISTRRLKVGVFTRPRPVSDIGPRGSLRRRLRGPCDPTVDLTAKRHKIDRLGEKRLCAAFQGFPPGIVVALGGDHDDWNVRSCSFRPGIRVRGENRRTKPAGPRGKPSCTAAYCVPHQAPVTTIANTTVICPRILRAISAQVVPRRSRSTFPPRWA